MRILFFGIYYRLTLKSRGKLFLFLFNFQNFILGKSGRVKYSNIEGCYLFTEEGLTRRFVSERVGTICYWKGLRFRAQRIASSYFADLVKYQANDLIIDCGANIGDLELFFYFNKINVRYLGYEPSPQEYFCLKKNLVLGKAFNLGLWDGDGSLNFHVSSENADSSFITPLTFSEVIEVPTRRLDNIILDPIKFLKVEAEGAEPEVLRGCQKILPRIQWISVDVGFERGINQENTVAEVCNFLFAQGFKLEKFFSPTGRWTALFQNPNFRSNV